MTITPTTRTGEHDDEDEIHSTQSSSTIADPEKGADETTRPTRVIRLARTLSRTSTREQAPPPDGGWFAWLQVALVHLTIINTWGFLNSFGFFQSYYVENLHRSPSDISWVGSFQLWLLFAVGVLAGRATDAGYFKLCYLVGTFFLVLGVFMISLCSEYWQFFLAQGICQGIGNGLIFIPSLTILPGYFVKKRVFAMATAAAGTATGGMIYPAIIQALLPKIGFQWTIRVIGFIIVALQVMNFCLLKQRIPPRKSGPLIEWQAFKEPTYTLAAISFFLINMGIWFAYTYAPSFARTILGSNQEDSNHLLLVLNGPGILGRLIPAFIADRYTGPMNILILCSFVTGITTFAWAGVVNYGGMIGWCAVYGFTSAGFLGLFPATLAVMTENPKKLGIRMGMTFTIVGFANLIGPPVSGALIERLNGRYLGAQIFAGLCCCIGSVVLVFARKYKVGWKLMARI